MKVLCIEDEPEMVDLIRLILQPLQVEVQGALGGEQGLTRARAERFDAILLDIMMPQMDGWEVFHRLKADPVTQSIPVIVVTAKAEGFDKVLGLHIAKVDAYITKPFGPQELIAAVDKVARESVRERAA